MSTGSILGPPLTVNVVPWALIVVPYGIEAIRANVGADSTGCTVGGTITHSPGST
jgi:hypothetical protein